MDVLESKQEQPLNLTNNEFQGVIDSAYLKHKQPIWQKRLHRRAQVSEVKETFAFAVSNFTEI